MQQTTVQKTQFLLPNTALDFSRWAVVACDQFTSQLSYWKEVEQFVGTAPSTYRLMLPEVYLGREEEARQQQIPQTMEAYLADGTLVPHTGFVYVRRTLQDGSIRKGLVAQVDLEDYDFTPGNHANIRATEATVLSRIPPRVAIRRQAPLELPHVLLLLCDETRTVIESLEEKYAQMEKLYDFALMQDGGRIEGYLVQEEDALLAKLDALYTQHAGQQPFLLIGDGNHSLASAKALWEEIKATLPEAEQSSHPARYALVEITNLYDESLQFEPIYRVAFGVEDPKGMATAFADYLDRNEGSEGYAEFRVCYKDGYAELSTDALPTVIEVETVDQFLQLYQKTHPSVTVDYVHGYQDILDMSEQTQVVAFVTAPFAKADLPWYIEEHGVLPKKTFSMGHAREKRYYLEARKITR